MPQAMPMGPNCRANDRRAVTTRGALALTLLTLGACCCSNGNGGTGGQTSGGGTSGGTSGRHTSGGSGSASSGSGGSEKLGAGCTAQATCQAGLTCLDQLPGGYCTEACGPGQPCSGAAQGGVCIEALPNQFACGLACSVDADCGRSGYACDPTCGVCVPTLAVGQITCPGADGGFPGEGGRKADGSPCGTLPADGGLAAFSASVNVSGGSATFAEEEPTLAVSDGGRIVIGFMTVAGDGGATNQLGVASSPDGKSFTLDAPIVGPDPLAFDPSVAVDSKGTFYYAFAGFNGGGNAPTGHAFLMSSGDGANWSSPVAINSPADMFYAGQSGGGIDKPFVAVNPATGSPNTVFTSFAGSYGAAGPYEIRIVAGMDAGGSFQDPALDIDSAPPRAAGRDLPSLAFDQTGNGYAVWVETQDPNQFAFDQVEGTQLTGTAQSQIFSAFVSLYRGGPLPPVSNVQLSAAGDDVVFDGPRVAASPDGTAVYAVYVVGSTNATDIKLAKSTTFAATWGTPVLVNDDPGCATHYHPTVARDASCNVWVSWVSNRDGTGRVYYAESTNGGANFSPSAVLSDQPFYFTTLFGVPAWIGGYQSLAFAGGSLYSAWSGAVGGTDLNSPAHVFFLSAAVP